jgi:hypothetical protein
MEEIGHCKVLFWGNKGQCTCLQVLRKLSRPKKRKQHIRILHSEEFNEFRASNIARIERSRKLHFITHAARVGRGEKYIQNFGGETSWDTFTTHIIRY